MAGRRAPEQLLADRLDVLAGASDWQATGVLGSYADCAWLRNHGCLESHIVVGEPSDRQLFYCPDCGEVVTAENYDECYGRSYPFYPRPRVCEWRVTPKGRRAVKRGALD